MERLGDFEIERVLGEGGTAIVYAARLAGEELALKVLRPELALSEREVAGFVAEAQKAQRVSHPSLVEFRAAGILPDGRPYIAMPRLHGESLAERIARGPIPLDTALRLFRGLAEALQALHEAGLVHRDIKPENVFLVGAEEHLVLLDLGIARDIHAPASTTTQAGLVRGTPAYMAPERFFGARASTLTDTYEAAVVLYAMIAGRLPWDQGQEARGRMSPRDPRAIVPVPELVAQALLRALSVDETLRPQSVRALLEDLEQAAISGASTLLMPAKEPVAAVSGVPGSASLQGDSSLAAGVAAAVSGVPASVVAASGAVGTGAPTLPSASAKAPEKKAIVQPSSDFTTQDTVALSTGRVRRRRGSWVPTVLAAVVLLGAGVGAGVFLARPRAADSSAGAGSSATAGASATSTGGAATATSATGTDGATPATSAETTNSEAPITAEPATTTSAVSVTPEAPRSSAAPVHAVAVLGSPAAKPSASASSRSASVVSTILECFGLESIYCGPDFKASDGGAACTEMARRNLENRRRPPSDWEFINKSCASERQKAMRTLAQQRLLLKAQQGK